MAERLPRCVQERALLRTQRARPRALNVCGQRQPMLCVGQITQRHERRAAERRVGRSFLERRAGNAWLTALEHLVGFHVTALPVQIRSALHEVAGPTRCEHGKTRRETRDEYDALDHPLKDNDGVGAKLAPH